MPLSDRPCSSADDVPDGPPEVTPDPRVPTPRRGRSRERRGRGPRGPEFLIGPWAPRGVPAALTRGERFDRAALAVMDEVRERWPDELGGWELAVEEVPLLPADWTGEHVPLSAYVAAKGGRPARLVLFRRPLERRTETRADLDAVLLTVVVEQVAEVLGISPGEVHPDYDED